MNEHFINSLQKYKKPDKDFIKNKDCIICLEIVDIESQKIVQLPCKCANSVFHIDCVVQFLKSGENKNFCPHCRGVYSLGLKQIVPLFETRIVPLEIVDQNNHVFEHNRKMTFIFIIHMFSNSIVNIINLSSIDDYPNNNIDIFGKTIMIICLCKLGINSYFMITITHNIEKISFWLEYSYVIQTIIFILVVVLVILLKKNNINIILILNNIFFFVGDLFFRLTIEYVRQNRVANIN